MPVWLDEPTALRVMAVLLSRAAARKYRRLTPWWARTQRQDSNG